MSSQRIHQLKNYLSHRSKRTNEHGLHSPFVYELYTNTVKNKPNPKQFDSIEQVRLELLLNNNFINTTDYGSGSKALPSPRRKISQIAKHFLKRRKEGQFFHRLITHLQPKKILELGTSLGITTAYLASNSYTNVVTLEGCPETSKMANKVFTRLNLNNINQVEGNIDDTLTTTLNSLTSIDLALIDANHNYAPTINYFNVIMEKAHNDTGIIIDDIYQKPEMTKAWLKICEDDRIHVMLDFYHFGIVFLRKEQRKQYFHLHFK